MKLVYKATLVSMVCGLITSGGAFAAEATKATKMLSAASKVSCP